MCAPKAALRFLRMGILAGGNIKTGLVFRAATASRIMRGHIMASPFPLSDRATDVRPGCKTQRIAPTLRQVADLVCAPTKETEYA
ncbi:hypothetical protein PoB_007567600 [Plakobranchus ocellatus]|uniref:Uncharacterized protein n=1 Tax=Plakobranchus ocellatus TaxID=259542 RepID=A0AAV4DZ97_9GAST|nr:hypothetical protein PoB_007567600 [Plakobranchus ocellatus]